MALKSTTRESSHATGRRRLSKADMARLAARYTSSTIVSTGALAMHKSAPDVPYVITDLGVIDVSAERWVLVEIAPGFSAREVQAITGVPLWACPDLAEVATS